MEPTNNSNTSTSTFIVDFDSNDYFSTFGSRTSTITTSPPPEEKMNEDIYPEDDFDDDEEERIAHDEELYLEQQREEEARQLEEEHEREENRIHQEMLNNIRRDVVDPSTPPISSDLILEAIDRAFERQAASEAVGISKDRVGKPIPKGIYEQLTNKDPDPWDAPKKDVPKFRAEDILAVNAKAISSSGSRVTIKKSSSGPKQYAPPPQRIPSIEQDQFSISFLVNELRKQIKMITVKDVKDMIGEGNFNSIIRTEAERLRPEPVNSEEEIIINYNELADTLAKKEIKAKMGELDLEKHLDWYQRLIDEHTTIILKHKRSYE